jgi:uncharacterized protein (TIGR00303 family)
MVLLAATDTASVAGISAAGSTPAARRLTAAADAELLLLGPDHHRPHALPPLPAGVTPALISHVVLRALGLHPLVIDLGCPTAPAIPHIRPAAGAAGGPSRCLSEGAAMAGERVRALLELGRGWGRRLVARHPRRPLLIAECVPGGTSTAQAVLTGLGVEAAGLVSGSLRRPAHALKAALVRRGLTRAGLGGDSGGEHSDPLAVLAAVGDPMQPLAAGLVLGAAAEGLPTLLAGGSQMAAVLALALALAPAARRRRVTAHAALATTAWVSNERDSDFTLLLNRVGQRWDVEPLAFAASLRFGETLHPALHAYERGYVKEGMGAGGLALLWELSGREPVDLAHACDLACHQLLRPDALPSSRRTASGPRRGDGPAHGRLRSFDG